jgi:galactitol-specific phosphotransferase system IIC component
MTMAWSDEVVSFFWPNVLVVLGVAVLAPVLLPMVGCVARPLAKGAVKAGLTVKDMAVGFVAEAREQISDLVAEAKAENYAKPEA